MTEQRHSRSDLHRIYYDKNHKYGSDDPANAEVTRRVLTVMLASDW
ncbi:DUF3768 domain-containing protein [Novosphingobium sp. B1]|nr:DUF3768 domain-containing protein [Novosphingobium sp. B1]